MDATSKIGRHSSCFMIEPVIATNAEAQTKKIVPPKLLLILQFCYKLSLGDRPSRIESVGYIDLNQYRWFMPRKARTKIIIPINNKASQVFGIRRHDLLMILMISTYRLPQVPTLFLFGINVLNRF